MAIIQISSDGERTVVDPGTPEEQARDWKNVLDLARPLDPLANANALAVRRLLHRPSRCRLRAAGAFRGCLRGLDQHELVA